MIAHPNESIHCTDLMGAEAIEKGQMVFDDKARDNYQNRILQIQEEMIEAEDSGHSEQLGQLQEEYDKIIDHLSKAVGKGGKTRKISGTVEKCRTAVTWRIRNAVKKINEVHPALGKHLDISIKTGIFCEYSPEHQTDWIL